MFKLSLDEDNEEEKIAEESKPEEQRDERYQELDPLIARKVSSNGPVISIEEKEPSSDIQLKPIGNGKDIPTLLEVDRVANTNLDKIQPELQAQVSTKSTRSGRRESGVNEAPVNLSFFLQQHKDTTQRTLISPQISFVMFQFLFTTVRPFTSEFLTKNVLELIFKKATFKECKRMEKQQPEYLYR